MRATRLAKQGQKRQHNDGDNASTKQQRCQSNAGIARQCQRNDGKDANATRKMMPA
jgi:hypothetical protein